MKKALLQLILVLLITAPIMAQHCSQGSVIITPVTFGQPGLNPLPEDLPCTVIGQPVSDTIYFQNFTTVQTFTLDSLKIDSINNLPPGLCWVMDRADNTYGSGQAGAIYVSGTTTGPPGQYKIRIVVNAYLNGLTLTNLDAEAATGMRYYVRTRCASAACTPLDTNSPYPAYIPYAPCPGPPPAIITALGPDSFCLGSSVVLSASTGSGYSYRWSTGATTDSITVTSSGSYTVTVYNGADSTVSAPTLMTVRNSPSALTNPSGTVALCQNDSVVLSAVSAGLAYSWSTGATTRSITVRNTGNYHLTVTDTYFCTATSTDTVVAGQSPAAVIITNGDMLTAGSGTGYQYQWFKNDTLIAGQTSEIYTVTANGSYTVEVTGASGCAALSSPTVISNVGIHDINGYTGLRLYPNPGEGQLTLETSGNTGDNYEIYDELGRSVLQGNIISDSISIDIRTQSEGIYYLTVRHNGASETTRFAIVR